MHLGEDGWSPGVQVLQEVVRGTRSVSPIHECDWCARQVVCDSRVRLLDLGVVPIGDLTAENLANGALAQLNQVANRAVILPVQVDRKGDRATDKGNVLPVPRGCTGSKCAVRRSQNVCSVREAGFPTPRADRLIIHGEVALRAVETGRAILNEDGWERGPTGWNGFVGLRRGSDNKRRRHYSCTRQHCKCASH